MSVYLLYVRGKLAAGDRDKRPAELSFCSSVWLVPATATNASATNDDTFDISLYIHVSETLAF